MDQGLKGLNMITEVPAKKIVGDIFLEEVKKRIFEEELPWLKRCLGVLSVEEVWYRPGRHIVSVGNLVLHIIGNSRQWIISGLGGAPDIRKREEEFLEDGPIPMDDLIYRLDQTFSGVEAILDSISAEKLLQVQKIQEVEETGIGIILSVLEHLSYHVGQVSYAVKAMKAVK